MAFNNNYCCVPECKSWAKKDTERQLTFHRFPEANARKVYIENEMGKHLMDHRKAWILKLKICKQVSKSMKVCSLHFNKDDYFHKGLMKQRGRILKKTAVPSQRLPVELGENCRLNKMVVCWAPGCNHYNLRETCSMFRWTVVLSADAFLCSCHFVDGNKENGPTLFVYFKEKQLRFPSPERSLQKKTPVQFDDTRI
ncbi:unnamed protein product [Callosobruchus maculatus]|uniref:THAP-type domain-containing protein n=1 Tax=Callosobruchus maculatus TaxID=64391 RepID=A0A653CIA9_CALMS|nr:unnamed protein product [Callosobruchus maculatus]